MLSITCSKCHKCGTYVQDGGPLHGPQGEEKVEVANIQVILVQKRQSVKKNKVEKEVDEEEKVFNITEKVGDDA